MKLGLSARAFVRRITVVTLALEALLMIGSASAQVPPLIPLPGRWSIPVPIFIDPNNPPDLANINLHNLPFTTQNGAQWAPAPTDSTGSNGFPGHLPANLLALRTEVPGDLFDIGIASLQFLYGFASVEMPTGVKIEDITNLNFDSLYEFQSIQFGYPPGGNCGGGSPRFQLGLDYNGDGVMDANVFVYVGPPPNFGGDQDVLNGPPPDDCTYGLWRHEDVLDGLDRFDYGQVVPFASYTDQATAAAAVQAAQPNYHVMHVDLVWDSYFFFPGKTTFWADNIRVNNFLLDEPGVGHACSLLVGLTGTGVCSQLGLGPEGT